VPRLGRQALEALVARDGRIEQLEAAAGAGGGGVRSPSVAPLLRSGTADIPIAPKCR
jgi:hypothetical protein